MVIFHSYVSHYQRVNDPLPHDVTLGEFPGSPSPSPKSRRPCQRWTRWRKPKRRRLDRRDLQRWKIAGKLTVNGIIKQQILMDIKQQLMGTRNGNSPSILVIFQESFITLW